MREGCSREKELGGGRRRVMERDEKKMNERNKAQEGERKQDKEKRKKMRGSNQEKRGSLYEKEGRRKKVEGREGWGNGGRQSDRQAGRQCAGRQNKWRKGGRRQHFNTLSIYYS